MQAWESLSADIKKELLEELNDAKRWTHELIEERLKVLKPGLSYDSIVLRVLDKNYNDFYARDLKIIVAGVEHSTRDVIGGGELTVRAPNVSACLEKLRSLKIYTENPRIFDVRQEEDSLFVNDNESSDFIKIDNTLGDLVKRGLIGVVPDEDMVD